MHPQNVRGRNDRIPRKEKPNQPKKRDLRARKRARGKYLRLITSHVNHPMLHVIKRQKSWIIDRYEKEDCSIPIEELQKRGLATVWPLILAA